MQGTKLSDGRWRVVVVLTGERGEKIRKGFERRTQKLAQDAALEFLRDNGRQVVDPTCGTVSKLVELVQLDLWKHLSPNTKKNYTYYIDMFLADHGELLVDEITPPLITSYLKRYSAKSKRTMDEHVKVLKSVFGYAASDLGWIDRSPVEDARKPKTSGKTTDWPVLTRAQFDKILPHLPKPYHLFYRLLAETGARPSEAWGVDTEERLEFIQDVWWFVVKRGKTEASTRRVPIPDALARHLQAAGKFPFSSFGKLVQPAKHLRDVWETAMEAAQIPYTRPYEVRAMRINEWRRMALPGLVRRTMVGHTSERTTNDWYDHVDAVEVLKALGLRSVNAKDEPE